MIFDTREHLDAGPDAIDPRCADEDPVHLTEPDDVEVGLEGVDLPAEGVAPNRDVEAAEQRARACVEATAFFTDADRIAKVSRGLGEAMVGIAVDSLGAGDLLAQRGW